MSQILLYAEVMLLLIASMGACGTRHTTCQRLWSAYFHHR